MCKEQDQALVQGFWLKQLEQEKNYKHLVSPKGYTLLMFLLSSKIKWG